MNKAEATEKAKKALDGIEIGYFDMAGGVYYPDFPYYDFFDDENRDLRKYCVGAFARMLGQWNSKASFGFLSVEMRQRFSKEYGAEEFRGYPFEKFLEAFYRFHEDIKADFPTIFNVITFFLIKIEKEHNMQYELSFPEVDSSLMTQIRNEILEPNEHLLNEYIDMRSFLKEIGIPPFFKSDI